MSNDANEMLHLATDIVSAYVSNNKASSDEIPALLQSTYSALNTLNEAEIGGLANREPAVPVSKSITPDYIICLEDGKKLKMLKRYIRTQYGLSPEEYRRRWGLAADYPMVAPNYAKKRSAFAKQIGLGKAAGSHRKAKKKTTARKRK